MSLWKDMNLEGKRALILHHDDLGMFQAMNGAYAALGFPTGSIMLPTGWAAEAALTTLPHADLGVHLTLTSEWDNLRYRPLTVGASLVDGSGHFYKSVEEAWAHMDAGEVAVELRAQIEAGKALNYDVTHIDTHMGSAMRPDIAQAYIRLAIEYRIAAFVPELEGKAFAPDDAKTAEELARVIAGCGLPQFRVIDAYNQPPQARRAWLVDTLSKAGPGVYHCLHHAALDTPELRAIRDWPVRAADYAGLQDADVRRVLGEFVPLTYRDVRAGLQRYGFPG